MISEQTAKRTRDIIQSWTPSETYDHEREFQSELQDILDRELNSGGGMGLGQQTDHVVDTEHGRSYCDVVVDDVVGIELKRDLDNSQTKKLKGQIDEHRKEYDYLLVVACGIDDMEGWRRIKNEYNGGFAMEPELAETKFIHKPKSEFGTSGSQQNKTVTGSAAGSSAIMSDAGEFDLSNLDDAPLWYQIAVLAIIGAALLYMLNIVVF
jgi:hypothetical protein